MNIKVTINGGEARAYARINASVIAKNEIKKTISLLPNLFLIFAD